MEPKELIQKYRARLVREGWIQSILCGLIVGFVLNIICSVAFMIFGVKYFWISILLFVVAAAAATPLFYFKKFNPTKKQVAARVDALGLEERILTMTQLEGDDSYIAQRQREDAKEALKSLNGALVKIAVSIPLIVAMAVTCLLGIGATTASALMYHNGGVLGAIEENNANKASENETFFEVRYDVVLIDMSTYNVEFDEGGMIDGDFFQVVANGASADPVMAIAEDDYVFAGWNDGYEEPYRQDMDIRENMVFVAMFVEMQDGDGDGEGEGEGPGEGDDIAPGEMGEGESNSDSSSNNGNNNSGDGDGEGASGSTVPGNQVIDGNTYYGNEYGNSYSDAKDAMNSDSNLSDGDKGIIGDYFNNIAN